jgi:hypothetical protein
LTPETQGASSGEALLLFLLLAVLVKWLARGESRSAGRRSSVSNPDTLRLLETQISTTDRQIDRLVYDLYDLTAEEIAIVEGR